MDSIIWNMIYCPKKIGDSDCNEEQDEYDDREDGCDDDVASHL